MSSPGTWRALRAHANHAGVRARAGLKSRRAHPTRLRRATAQTGMKRREGGWAEPKPNGNCASGSETSQTRALAATAVDLARGRRSARTRPRFSDSFRNFYFSSSPRTLCGPISHPFIFCPSFPPVSRLASSRW